MSEQDRGSGQKDGRSWWRRRGFAVVACLLLVAWLGYLTSLAVTDDRECPGSPGCSATEH